MYAGWGEVCKSLVVLLLAGEERFERSSRVVLEKSVALMRVLCVAFGVAFGVDAWRGRGGLLIHVLLEGLLLMLSTEKEFERSIVSTCFGVRISCNRYLAMYREGRGSVLDLLKSNIM